MGVVYEARDLQLRRPVALKLLAPHLLDDEAARERFLREGRTGAALSHPNICPVYDLGVLDDGAYLVMALLEGESLKNAISKGPLPVRRSLEIAIQVAKALAAAHKQGIVHRDIKPANIMAGPDGRAVVMDFGLAHLVDATRLTDSERLIGTVAYLPPEAAEGKPADHRADIWALGCVLYEMLTSALPFGDGHGYALLYKVVHSSPTPIFHYRKDVPELVWKIILRCLEKDPARRIGSAEDLAKLLEGARESLASSPAGLRVAKPPRFSRRAWFAVAGAAVVATGFGLYRGGRNLPFVGGEPLPNSQDRVAIAVMPFRILSGTDLDFFAEGLADDLIHFLGEIQSLRVTALSSVLPLKGASAVDVGERLQVGWVVEGTIRLVGGKLVVNATLVNVDGGINEWSGRFENDPTNLLHFAPDLARAIVQGLPRWFGRTQPFFADVRTDDPRAYEAWLRGLQILRQIDPTTMPEAERHFNHALQLDPDYPLPYVGLAQFHNLLAQFGPYPPQPLLAKALQEIGEALRLDPAVACSHDVHGQIRQARWEWAESEAAFLRARDLEPSYAVAHRAYAGVLAVLGRHDDSIKEAETALELDPQSAIANYGMALSLNTAGKYQEALRYSAAALKADPLSRLAMYQQALSHRALDRPEEALQVTEGAAMAFPEDPFTLALYGSMLIRTGRKAEAADLEKKIDDITAKRYVSHLPLAFIPSARGDVDLAIEQLQVAAAERDPWLPFAPLLLRDDPEIASDPRFQEIVRGFGMPQPEFVAIRQG